MFESEPASQPAHDLRRELVIEDHAVRVECVGERDGFGEEVFQIEKYAEVTVQRVARLDAPGRLGPLVRDQRRIGRRAHQVAAAVDRLGPDIEPVAAIAHAEVAGLVQEAGQGSTGGRGRTGVVAFRLELDWKRIAQRASLGVGIVGGRGENSSGDLFLAFSTANADEISKNKGLAQVQMLPNDRINPLFNATVNATEEAIVNAMVAAETMTGVDGNRVPALPVARLQEILKRHNRLALPTATPPAPTR